MSEVVFHEHRLRDAAHLKDHWAGVVLSEYTAANKWVPAFKFYLYVMVVAKSEFLNNGGDKETADMDTWGTGGVYHD